MTQQQEDIPQPQGTKSSPLRRTLRFVAANSGNHSLIIGIPSIVAELAGVGPGDIFEVYYDSKGKIILEKKYN
jgi:hypothetical protein